MAKHIYGIDFGTSNSVLAAFDPSKKEVVKVISEASLLYFEDRETFSIGSSAISGYIENNMNGRLLKSIKTLLPQQKSPLHIYLASDTLSRTWSVSFFHTLRSRSTFS